MNGMTVASFRAQTTQGGVTMIRKLSLCAFLTGALLLGGVIQPRSASGQTQTEKQTRQETKSVTGKVMSIGSGGRSFTLEVSGKTADQPTMDFVVDKNTQVQGEVKQGTPVTVEYLVMESGQNLAVNVTAQA
jgi:hypothetical protein